MPPFSLSLSFLYFLSLSLSISLFISCLSIYLSVFLSFSPSFSLSLSFSRSFYLFLSLLLSHSPSLFSLVYFSFEIIFLFSSNRNNSNEIYCLQANHHHIKLPQCLPLCFSIFNIIFLQNYLTVKIFLIQIKWYRFWPWSITYTRCVWKVKGVVSQTIFIDSKQKTTCFPLQSNPL